MHWERKTETRQKQTERESEGNGARDRQTGMGMHDLGNGIINEFLFSPLPLLYQETYKMSM